MAILTMVRVRAIDLLETNRSDRHRPTLPATPATSSYPPNITDGKSAMSNSDTDGLLTIANNNSDQQKSSLLHLDDKNVKTTNDIPHLIKTSAPGKFILSGEYSVVYGKHAVAVSIDLRTTVYIKPNNNDRVSIELKNIKHVRSWPVKQFKHYRLVPNPNDILDYKEEIMLNKLKPLMDSCYISSAKAMSIKSTNEQQQKLDDANNNYLDYSDRGIEIIEKCGCDAVVAFLLLYIGITDSYSLSSRPAIDVIVESQLPIGCGLGSSSAYSVALCGALMRLIDVKLDDSLQSISSSWAFAIDRYFHGTPSGIDNNIIAHGGSILFHQGQIKQHKHRPLALTAILVDTCVTRSTKTSCKKVAEKLADPEFNSHELFNDIDDITQSAWNELISDKFTMSSMDPLLNKNQQLLDRLGVGHSALTDIIDCCSQHGYCAKMTGAGGGGTAFLLVENPIDENLTKLKRMLASKGYRYYETHVGGKGLQVS